MLRCLPPLPPTPLLLLLVGDGVGDDVADGVEEADADAGLGDARDQRGRQPLQRPLIVLPDVGDHLRLLAGHNLGKVAPFRPAG